MLEKFLAHSRQIDGGCTSFSLPKGIFLSGHSKKSATKDLLVVSPPFCGKGERKESLRRRGKSSIPRTDEEGYGKSFFISPHPHLFSILDGRSGKNGNGGGRFLNCVFAVVRNAFPRNVRSNHSPFPQRRKGRMLRQQESFSRVFPHSANTHRQSLFKVAE